MIRYPQEKLSSFSVSCLQAAGVDRENAETATQLMLFADQRGHGSHGIVRLPVYGRRLVAGKIQARGEPRTLKDTGAAALVEGKNLLGPVVGRFSMTTALSLAKNSGMGFVLARNSNHYGASAYYTTMASRNGLIGISCSNAPPNMAPFGGRERFLGTNPLSIAVPLRGRPDLVLDMATSVVARGKIILAAQKGETIPEGWALDPQGRATTDAAQALLGCVLPFGGPKGSAISLLIDIFSGLMSGAAYGRHLNTLEDLENVQNLGHLFMALDPFLFQTEEEFYRRMDDLVEQLKETPKAEGFEEILYPGEIEERTARRNREEGLPLTGDVIEQLNEFARSLGVEELN